jgi:F0F1-type ATP synthase assembly protein I
VEYSNISGMTFKDNRKRTIAAGLFGGLTFIILGIIIVILILSLPDESVHSTAYVGLLFIILGIIFGTLILTRKTQFWQIHLKDKAVQNSSKWRILKDKSTEADKFLNIIKEKAGIEVT